MRENVQNVLKGREAAMGMVLETRGEGNIVSLAQRLSEKVGGERLFYIFGFLSYAGAFALRIGRDVVLFTSLFGPQAPEWLQKNIGGGAGLLGLVFIVNAFLMTWFAGWVEKKLEAVKAERAGRFFLTGVVVGSVGIATFLAISQGGADAFWGFFPFAALVIYIVSELPIFLFMNLLWIYASPRFSEVRQREVFPKISAWAYFGILFPVIIALGILASDFGGAWILFGLAGVAALLALLLIRLVEGQPEIDMQVEDVRFRGDEKKSATEGKSPSLLENWKWAKTEKFLHHFIWVTIANFMLLAIFDQAMASAATASGVSEKGLLLYISLAYGFFAFISGVLSLFFFSRLLDRFGAEKMNLVAPVSMLLGALAMMFAMTDWITGELPPANRLLWFAIAARTFGWIAEFLFNQSLLPYIYGALPRDVENRGRLFVEGPVTAITNGIIGLLLLAYVFFFNSYGLVQQVEGGAALVRFDLLVVLAIVFAVVMLYLSIQMLGEYREVLLRRLRSGDIVENLDKQAMAFIERQRAQQLGDGGSLRRRSSVVSESDASAEDKREELFQRLANRKCCPDPEEMQKLVAEALALDAIADERFREKMLQWFSKAGNREFLHLLEALHLAQFDSHDILRDVLKKKEREVAEMSGEDPRLLEGALLLLEAAGILRSTSLARRMLDRIFATPQSMDALLREACLLQRPDVVAVLDFPEHARSLEQILVLLPRLTSERGPVLRSFRHLIERKPWLGYLFWGLMLLRLEGRGIWREERSRSDRTGEEHDHLSVQLQLLQETAPLVLATLPSSALEELKLGTGSLAVFERTLEHWLEAHEDCRNSRIGQLLNAIAEVFQDENFREWRELSIQHLQTHLLASFCDKDDVASDDFFFSNLLHLLAMLQLEQAGRQGQQRQENDGVAGNDGVTGEALEKLRECVINIDTRPPVSLFHRFQARIWIEFMVKPEAFDTDPAKVRRTAQLFLGGLRAEKGSKEEQVMDQEQAKLEQRLERNRVLRLVEDLRKLIQHKRTSANSQREDAGGLLA